MIPKFIRNRWRLWSVLAGVLLSFLLYGNTIYGDFVYDDVFFSTRPELREAGHLFKVWLEPLVPKKPATGTYRPLTVFTLALNFILFGEETWSFHAVNILFNGIATALVGLVIYEIFGSSRLALFSAAIFAFFPIHTEAVANIKSRDSLISAILILAAWFWWFRAERMANKRWFLIILSNTAVFLAMLAQEFSIMAPFVFVASSIWLIPDRWQEMLRRGVWFFLPLAGYLFLRWHVMGNYAFGNARALFIFEPLSYVPWFERAWTAFQLLFLYVGKTIVPWSFSATYHYAQIVPISDPFASWQSLAGMGVMLGIVWLIFDPRTRRTPFAVGALTFFVSYLIFSKFIFKGGDIFGERWMYFPSLGIALMLGYVFDVLWRRHRRVAYAALAAVLISYSLVIIPRNLVWRSNETLFKNMIETAPLSLQGYTSLAKFYYDEKDFDKALEIIEKGMRIYSDHPPLLEIYAKIKHERRNYASARDLAERMTKIDPESGIGWRLYAIELTLTGEYRKSIEIVETRIPYLLGDFADLRQAMAVSYYKLGDLKSAEEFFDWDPSMSYDEKIRVLRQF